MKRFFVFILSVVLMCMFVVGCSSGKIDAEKISYYNQFKDKICSGTRLVAAINQNGMVEFASEYDGHQEDIEEYTQNNWNNIIKICSDDNYTVALKENGTLVGFRFGESTGMTKKVYLQDGRTVEIPFVYCYNGFGNQILNKWKDIVDITISRNNIVGLKSDGTLNVFAMHDLNNLEDAEKWKDITKVSISDEHIVGLKSDGTVVAVGDNYSGETNLKEWKDIVDVSAEDEYTVGLKSDGTIIFAGKGHQEWKEIEKWQNIVKVYTSYSCIIGIRADGKVVMTDDLYEKKRKTEIESWKDIVDISIGDKVIGLDSEGRVITETDTINSETIQKWKLF